MRTKEISPGAQPRPKMLNTDHVGRRREPRKPKEHEMPPEETDEDENDEYNPDKKKKDKTCRGKMINIVI